MFRKLNFNVYHLGKGIRAGRPGVRVLLLFLQSMNYGIVNMTKSKKGLQYLKRLTASPSTILSFLLNKLIIYIECLSVHKDF